ncbi:MAG: hypothetical protein JSV49_04485 [Thermoplasmata archaeon]|nr:MAG: hypothetical protein JSV49_04485 [Thermoplasmata archaeon]
MKYEKLAIDEPDKAAQHRERRRTILKIYLRIVVLTFILAVIAELIDLGYLEF